MNLLGTLQLIFIVLKVAELVGCSWIAVLSPMWIAIVLAIGLFMAVKE